MVVGRDRCDASDDWLLVKLELLSGEGGCHLALLLENALRAGGLGVGERGNLQGGSTALVELRVADGRTHG